MNRKEIKAIDEQMIRTYILHEIEEPTDLPPFLESEEAKKEFNEKLMKRVAEDREFRRKHKVKAFIKDIKEKISMINTIPFELRVFKLTREHNKKLKNSQKSTNANTKNK